MSNVKQLLGLLLGGSLVLSPNALALQPDSAKLVAQASTQNYWPESVDLLQTQVNLLTQVEQSLYSTQRNYVASSYRKLFFYIGKLDRYLETYGVASRPTCINQPLSGSELAAYCALFESRSTLFTLLATTEQRQSRLGTGEDSLLFPAFGSSLISSEITPQESWQSETETFDVMATDAAKPLQNQGDIIRPAIAPVPEIVAAIAKQKSALLAVTPQLPAGYALADETVFNTTTTRYQYMPTPQEYAQHQAFLSQPNTGISRLLPRDAYEEPNTTSRLKASLREQFPFPVLTDAAIAPNLPLIFEGESLRFIPESLDLSLIEDLGTVDFDAAKKLAQNHSLTSYQSPTTFAGLQQEQRRLLFQKDAGSMNIAPLALNHTYLVRLIQYEFSPEILEGKVLPRYRFKEINMLAKPPSNDVLVAVQPVKNWLDGSYTILWQVLDQKPAATITDLADYITVDSPSQP
ncbi:MAG: hypothetical protein WBB82_10265 [Limnothrix sp.]